MLGAAIFFPVALRRRRPVPAFCALIILAVLATATGPAGATLVFFVASYVLYTVTVTGNKQTGIAALTFALAVVTVMVLLARAHQIPVDRGNGVDVVVVFALIISWMTGYSVRQRRLYAQMLQHEAASSAVNEERLRIARELHDVVAHSMSVIAVQAGYGQYVIDDSPADARDALGAIQATSRDALEEMRRMLGVLRQQDAAPGFGLGSPADYPAADAARAGAGTAARGAGGGPGRGAAAAGRLLRRWRRRQASPTSGGSSSALAAPACGSSSSVPGLSVRCRRGRPVGVPDHPGGADQRGQARGQRRLLHGQRRLRRGRPGGPGHRRRRAVPGALPGRRGRGRAMASSACVSGRTCAAASSAPGRWRRADSR